MAKTVYKVDSFDCTLSSRGKFTSQLQEIIDKYAADGWKYYSCATPGAMGALCVVVFFKEEE